MLKIFLIKTGLRIIGKMANKLMDNRPDTLEDVVVNTIKDEVTDMLRVLPNVVTDEARRLEQSRRAKEGR